jgi:sulfonate transport system ATP-binding protein
MSVVQAAHGLAIRIRGLGKRFGMREVLREVNLEIAPGEFVAIVGRSGCGKSTLLRLLAGLDQPSSGSIETESNGIGDTSSEVRIMFQDARLLPWRSVVDNVAIGLQRFKHGQAVEQLLGQVGLADRGHDWPSKLSGGQRQRVSLARALVHHPQLLLLDEPLGALDALTRIEMQTLVERIWQQRGFTAVLVTHDIAEAVSLADRVILIEDGRLAAQWRIPIARPRDRGLPELARLEADVLQRVLGAEHGSVHRTPPEQQETRELADLIGIGG